MWARKKMFPFERVRNVKYAVLGRIMTWQKSRDSNITWRQEEKGQEWKMRSNLNMRSASLFCSIQKPEPYLNFEMLSDSFICIIFQGQHDIWSSGMSIIQFLRSCHCSILDVPGHPWAPTLIQNWRPYFCVFGYVDMQKSNRPGLEKAKICII